jgi:hypothetical protein
VATADRLPADAVVIVPVERMRMLKTLKEKDGAESGEGGNRCEAPPRFPAG